MDEGFLTRLMIPSPVMAGLLLLLPLTIAMSGIFGAAERHSGNRRLALWAIVLAIWLFLPLPFADPLARQISGMISILGWLGLVGYWARHVWHHWPSPVWAHGLVIGHLMAIVIGAVIAVIRAV